MQHFATFSPDTAAEEKDWAQWSIYFGKIELRGELPRVSPTRRESMSKHPALVVTNSRRKLSYILPGSTKLYLKNAGLSIFTTLSTTENHSMNINGRPACYGAVLPKSALAGQVIELPKECVQLGFSAFGSHDVSDFIDVSTKAWTRAMKGGAIQGVDFSHDMVEVVAPMVVRILHRVMRTMLVWNGHDGADEDDALEYSQAELLLEFDYDSSS
mmetsp:Transcript_7454/g.13338  ORF Transcript_7454/g.13338 Transcript_7454/m.13338 type:complete len:214 (-) Transcript_7454:74-715(-)